MSGRRSARSLPYLLTLLSAVTLIHACGGKDGATGPAPVTVSLSPATLTLFVGETGSLTATVTGSTASATFSSSNAAVATVSGAGVVTAVAPGTTTITAAAAGATTTAQVTVTPSTISLDATTLILDAGDTGTLVATVTGGTGHTVSWASSAESVATVDDAGVVSALSAGTGTITASVDGQPGVEATATVTVTFRPPSVTFDGFTQNGAAADPTSLSGVVTAQLTLDVPPNFEGTLSIFFDDIEMASVELPEPQPAQASGRFGNRAPGQLLVDVNTAQVQLISDMFVASLPNGRDFSAYANLAPKVSTEPTVRADFSGTVRTNNDPVVVINGIQFSGEAHVPSVGVEINTGSLSFNASYVSFDETAANVESMDMIEILKGPQGALFGGTAVNNVVSLSLSGVTPFPDGLGGEDGTWEFGPMVRVMYASGMVGLRALVTLPGSTGSLTFDNRPPEDAEFFLPSRWFGAGTNLQLWAALNGFDYTAGAPSDRFGGIKECELRAGSDLANPEFRNFSAGIELRITAGLDLPLGAWCSDWLGNSRTYSFKDPLGGLTFLGGTFQTPKATWASGSVRDRQLNPTGDFMVEATDPANSLGGSSGIDMSEWRYSLTARTPTGTTCVTGTDDGAGGCAHIMPTFPFSSWMADFPTGSSETTTSVQVRNNAGTWSAPLLSWNIHDLTPPTLTGTLVTDGLLFDNVDEGESFSGLTGNDDFDLREFAMSAKYGDLDISIGYLRDEISPAYNGEFISSFTLDATAFRIPRSLQIVKFVGFNWEPQSEISAPAMLTGEIKDAGRNVLKVDFAVASQLSPATTTTFRSGGLDDYRFWGPITLCNLRNGGNCSGIPEEGVFNIQSFTMGTFDFTRAVLYRVPVRPDGTQVAWELADEEQLIVTDFGSFSRLDASFTFTGNQLASALVGRDFRATEFVLFVLLFNAFNDALMSNLLNVTVFTPS